MQHSAAFHQGMHCLQGLKEHSGIEMHHNLEIFICDPFKLTMDNPILIVSICMGQSISIQRVKQYFLNMLSALSVNNYQTQFVLSTF